MKPADVWDIFCKVIDNFGDIGVCWRLAADLADRGQRVRLWCDDPSALEWMAPDGARGVEVRRWPESGIEAQPGDVVVEAFGCDPPAGFVQRMAQRTPAPVWINLEYLSAEAWVERCHGLPSPQSHGPGAGLVKWFFYPGFTPRTGGLIRELDLVKRMEGFDRSAWLRQAGIELRPGERLVTLFCYANPALTELIPLLGEQATLLALAPGPGRAQARSVPWPAGLRGVDLPWLSQKNYDHLLWSADFNIVRGEDSLVRATWAGRPFLWQLYPQGDAAHTVKSVAFLDRFLKAGAASRSQPAPWEEDLKRLWSRWNGDFTQQEAASEEGGLRPRLAWPDPHAWAMAATIWRECLLRQTDLGTQLLEFAARHTPAPHRDRATTG